MFIVEDFIDLSWGLCLAFVGLTVAPLLLFLAVRLFSKFIV